MTWPRLQLFELNDLHQTPEPLRDLIIESLSRTLAWGRMLDGVVAPFEHFLATSGADQVLDICAGAGGPSQIVASAMRREGKAPAQFWLTDLFPRIEHWRPMCDRDTALNYVAEPVDATAIARTLAAGRARMIVNALHHFPPQLAQAIVADAVENSRGLFISEAFHRHPLGFLPMIPAAAAAFVATPLLSAKDRLKKAAFSFLTPLGAGASIWDGWVSSLRVYTEDELRELVRPTGDKFSWTFGSYRFWPHGHGYYFYGVPK